VVWTGQRHCTKAQVGHSSDDLGELSIVLVRYQSERQAYVRLVVGSLCMILFRMQDYPSEENPYCPRHHERRNSFSCRASYGDSDEEKYEYVDGLHSFRFHFVDILGLCGLFSIRRSVIA
jgi:hypothetical protein